MSSNEVIAHLTDGAVSVVVVSSGGMPEVAHWGGAVGPGELDPAAFVRPVVGGGLDVDAPVGLLPESACGWFGRPGIEMHRSGGRDIAPRLTLDHVDATGHHLDVRTSDPHSAITVTIRLTLAPSGLLVAAATLRNDGADALVVGAVRLTLPVPAQAGELLTLGGRHTYEFVPTRTEWNRTCVTIENRHGKTSHERLGAVFAGTPAFGEHAGEVWACHLGWSGNFELICDAVTDGHQIIQAGELLLQGEVELEPGESYTTPTVYAAYSAAGLNPISNAFHDHVRARSRGTRLPRPVHLNTWEAVYFEHDATTLRALADAAAEVGIERFVLDDGWFGGRRDDHRGLGDWSVSANVWPDGLAPLIDHVRGLGMEFGIWVEPEMVNPDSDLYRAHPDWALVDQRYPHVLGRNQLVLDLGRPEVRDHLFERLDALLADHDIAYVKWDHNRDLVSPMSLGRAGVHRQTLGAYELLDRLHAAHPDIEIETCASGGGRVDLGILERTDRVWVSDSIDALDRHTMQRGFSLLFPPELMGSHIGAPTAHATLRTHRLGFRAVAAMFGAFGVEWNLLDATPDERDQLADLISLHKRFRGLLHTGTVIRHDHPDTTVEVHGVVAADRSEAVFAITRLNSAPTHHTSPIRFHGLDDAAAYEARLLDDIGEPLGLARRQPPWVHGKLTATGRQLRVAGFHAPQLNPESSVILHLQASGPVS